MTDRSSAPPDGRAGYLYLGVLVLDVIYVAAIVALVAVIALVGKAVEKL